MAIKEIRREWSPCQLGYVKEFLLHTEDDLKNMPRCSVGSRATVSETDNEYVKTADGWMLLCDCDEDGGQGAGGGGTGGGGSVSWNDLTDKPFGTAYEYKEILNTEVEVGENGFGRIYTPSGSMFTHKWVVGQTYKIVFNGVEYLCEAWETDGSFYVGNGDIYGGAGKGGDEPFAIEYWSDNWLYSAGPATYSLIVYAPEETVKKLDSKYLDTWDFVIHRTSSSGTYTSTWAKGNVNDLWNALRNKQCPNVCVVTTKNEIECMNIPIKMEAAFFGSNQVHITIWDESSSSGKSPTILKAEVSNGSITES